jgi:DNA-binding ferritin-like protein
LNIVELDFSEKHKFFQEQYEAIDEIIDEGAEDIKDSQLVLIDRVGYGFYYEQRKKSTRNQFALLDYHMKKTMSFNHNFYLSISSSGVAIVLSSIALGGA